MQFIKNLKISARLLLSVIVFLLPLAYLLYAYSKVQMDNITFAEMEVKGNAYQRPLVASMSGINENILSKLDGKTNNTSKIEKSLSELTNIDSEIGETLAYTDEKLGEQKNLKAANIKSKLSSAKENADYSAVFDDIKASLDYVSLTSNLVLDPDLDSCYIMDVTSIKIPTTLQRFKNILLEITPLVEAGANITADDKTKIAVYAALISDIDIAGVKGDFSIALAKDADFYGSNPSLKSLTEKELINYAKTNTTLAETLKKIAANPGSVSKSEFLSSVSAANASATTLWSASVTTLDELLAARISSYELGKYKVWGGSGIVITLAFLFFFYVAGSIKKPLKLLQNSMVKLAGGDLSTEVPCSDLQDEIGEMAQTVQHFKETSVKAKQLDDEQRIKFAKDAMLKKTMDESIKNFESKVAVVLSNVGAASSKMSGMSKQMLELSGKTISKTKETIYVTAEASNNVSAVAAAAEELSASINEISSQITHTTNISRDAVSKAQSTDKTIDKLSSSASRVNEIVALIGTIAEQINMLALNATIESARAGEAGKGFAVVASEVKNLANQAAKATETIGTQIAAMQGVVDEVVSAIKDVRHSIEETDKISTSIAAAVEEQGTATKEIAANIQQTSDKVATVSGNMNSVGEIMNVSNENSQEFVDSANSFISESEKLKQEIEQFLAGIRKLQ